LVGDPGSSEPQDADILRLREVGEDDLVTKRSANKKALIRSSLIFHGRTMMTVTAYNNVMNSAAIPLQNSAFTVVVKLRVPNTGNFVVFGKVNMENLATTPQGLVVYLTTNDGAMVLDIA
jgi:hypothetical protein